MQVDADQQPLDPTRPVVPGLTDGTPRRPGFVVAAFNDPSDPAIVAPATHGAVLMVGTGGALMAGTIVVVMLGAGTTTMGLTPALPISVAPSGMVPGLVDAAPLVGMVEEVPNGVLPNAAVLQPVDSDVVPLAPPPSKVDMVPVVPVLAKTLLVQFVLLRGAGLNPPGSISVAPSGTPVEPAGTVAPIMPSGDVRPIAGIPVTDCAKAGVPPNAAATIAAMNRHRIEASMDRCV